MSLIVCAEADLMHSFPEDVFVFVLVDVFALIVRFDGKLYLLHCPFLGVKLLQVLGKSGNRHVKLTIKILIIIHTPDRCGLSRY